jgi:hypothetical protein
MNRSLQFHRMGRMGRILRIRMGRMLIGARRTMNENGNEERVALRAVVRSSFSLSLLRSAKRDSGLGPRSFSPE